MKSLKPTPTKEELDQILNYDPVTGDLTWKHRPYSMFSSKGNYNFIKNREGTLAGVRQKQKNGSPHCIRIRITINGKGRSYVAHRLIFTMMGIPVPNGYVIDHIDRNPWNNSLSNLRIATFSENSANSCMGKKNKLDPSLPKGIDWHPRLMKYRVQIMKNRVKRHIGLYTNLEDAKKAWMKEASKDFGEFVCA